MALRNIHKSHLISHHTLRQMLGKAHHRYSSSNRLSLLVKQCSTLHRKLPRLHHRAPPRILRAIYHWPILNLKSRKEARHKGKALAPTKRRKISQHRGTAHPPLMKHHNIMQANKAFSKGASPSTHPVRSNIRTLKGDRLTGLRTNREGIFSTRGNLPSIHH